MCGKTFKPDAVKAILKNVERYGENNLSEIDTQNFLVEPILCIDGYNIGDPFIGKRASRDPCAQEFDIEVYNKSSSKKPILVIEIKALKSDEFNIEKICKKDKKVGKLKEIEKGKWKNKPGDGVGQLRAYCANYRDKIGENTVPILTNGVEWILFKRNKFMRNYKEPVTEEDVLIRASIKDKNPDNNNHNIKDINELIKKIKNKEDYKESLIEKD